MTLAVDYEGVINDRMAGFYRSAVAGPAGRRWIAITQFQESDARRAFPCFDRPADKGVFEIDLTVDRGLTALSNTAAAEETLLDGGRRRVRFAPTPPMSTYLVFFGIGEFEVTGDPVDPRVRLVAPPGRTALGEMGRAFGRRSLAYCEDYFGIPYPLEKLDLVAVPDFAFGAMENWGAVTFRENLLLDDPETTSKAGRSRICEVIAHEITHQWFGNLATPVDWSYLWLNESFATYFGYGIVDHYHPDWRTWDRFLLDQTHHAMERDALRETHPMEIPGGEHVVINASTAPLVYSKGASILRQFHAHIGEDRFRQGLRRYLADHRYANADSGDFWRAFDGVSDAPVSGVMRRWVEQRGFPFVTAAREGRRGLRLAQERFCYLGAADAARWPIPIVLRLRHPDGSESTRRLLLEDSAAVVDIGDAAAWKLNAGQTGFYRAHYADPEAREALDRWVGSGRLGERDRWGVQEDRFAMAMAGRGTLSDYLALVARMDRESGLLPLTGVGRNLYRAHAASAPDARTGVAAAGRVWCERILDTVGWEPDPDESHPAASLRDRTLWHGVVFGAGPVREFALERFEDLKAGRAVAADLLPGVLQAGAWHGEARDLAWLVGRLDEAQSEHERLALLQALGSMGSRECLAEAFDYVLDRVPDRNRFVPLVAMAATEPGAEVLWEAYRRSLHRFDDFHPLLYERVLAALVTGCGMRDPDGVRAFFAEHLENRTVGREVVRLSLERLEILTAFRGRSGGS
jgi:tricorn protease interacting factor F2/3